MKSLKLSAEICPLAALYILRPAFVRSLAERTAGFARRETWLEEPVAAVLV